MAIKLGRMETITAAVARGSRAGNLAWHRLIVLSIGRIDQWPPRISRGR
jgi:hypothetical protein